MITKVGYAIEINLYHLIRNSYRAQIQPLMESLKHSLKAEELCSRQVSRF